MRINGTLYFILKDHLGSSSIMTDASGTIAGEDRFYPYGETRFTTGTMYTDKLFTGQREITGLGIYHYGARFYSPKLGRFISPDTIVPGQPIRRLGIDSRIRSETPSNTLTLVGTGSIVALGIWQIVLRSRLTLQAAVVGIPMAIRKKMRTKLQLALCLRLRVDVEV